MRIFSQVNSLAAILTVLCFCILCSTANAQWLDYSQNGNGENYVEFGLRIYDRPDNENFDFPLITNGTTGVTLFDGADASDGGNAVGVELSYHFQTRHHNRFEFRTFLANFESESVIGDAGPGNLSSTITPFFGGTFDTIDFELDTQLFSFELNRKRAVRDGITLFAGPRFVSFDDEVTSAATFTDGAATNQDLLSVEAINHLIGAQVGVRLNGRLGSRVRGVGLFRIGGYFNPTTVRTTNTTGTIVGATGLLIPTTSVDTDETESTEAFLAEVGGKLFFDITDKLSFFAGYEATWIDGLALASPSLINFGGPEVDTNNTLFLNAITVGFSFQW